MNKCWVALYRGRLVDPTTGLQDINRITNVILFVDLPGFGEVQKLTTLIFGYGDSIGHTWGEMPIGPETSDMNEDERYKLNAFRSYLDKAEACYQHQYVSLEGFVAHLQGLAS